MPLDEYKLAHDMKSVATQKPCAARSSINAKRKGFKDSIMMAEIVILSKRFFF